VLDSTQDQILASVRAELERQGVSGRELARRLRRPHAQVAARLAGTATLTAAQLVEFADVLGIPAREFLPERVAA